MRCGEIGRHAEKVGLGGVAVDDDRALDSGAGIRSVGEARSHEPADARFGDADAPPAHGELPPDGRFERGAVGAHDIVTQRGGQTCDGIVKSPLERRGVATA